MVPPSTTHLPYAMASAVEFDDIFDEAVQSLPPMLSMDQNGATNAHSTLGSTRSVTGSSSTTSYFLTISLATVVLVAVYWVYSYIETLRRRRREAFYQLCVIRHPHTTLCHAFS